jgi:hypothetical protein
MLCHDFHEHLPSKPRMLLGCVMDFLSPLVLAASEVQSESQDCGPACFELSMAVPEDLETIDLTRETAI